MKASWILAALCAATPVIAAPVFGVRQDFAAPINPIALEIADLNGDAARDLVLIAPGNPPSQGQLATFFGRGDGYFCAGPSSACARSPYRLAAGHLDGDAYSDVALSGRTVATANEDLLQVLRGQGDGTFVLTAFENLPDGGAFGGIAIADFSGDGIADVAAAHANGYDVTDRPAWLFDGRGDGTLEAPQYLGTTSADADDLAAADMNQDGTLDLALTSNTAASAFLLHVPEDDWIESSGNVLGTLLALGRLDGDAQPDAVYAHPTRARISVVLSTGSTFDIPLPVVTKALKIADVDGDGHDDIVTLADFPGRVQFRAGHGNGTFDAAVDYAVGTRPLDVAVADVNADGLVDLVTTNNGSASVTVLLQGNPVVGTTPSPARFALAPPFPNPTRGAVSLTLELASDDACDLGVHDVRGRLVESRALAHPLPGPQTVRVFEAANPAPGIYWVTLRQGPNVASQRFVVLP